MVKNDKKCFIIYENKEKYRAGNLHGIFVILAFFGGKITVVGVIGFEGEKLTF